jgi:hypothetical protein
MEKTDYVLLGLVVLILLFAICYSLGSTYIEMKTFNKFSKTKATYVEALFTNLRVIPD